MNLRATLLLIVIGLLARSIAPANAQDRPTHPVVVIPGILGSKLCRDDNGQIVWGDTARGSFTNFKVLDLSISNPVKLHACGIVNQVQVLGPLYSVDAYVKLISSLKEWGLEEGEDLFIFDYDWRRSNVQTAKALEEYIDGLTKKFPRGQKFNIVAHSMGGLVARLYLENTRTDPHVNKVIYLGTPFLGSANTLGTLSEGWGAIQNWVAGGMGTIRRVALSFPSLLELLPRYKDCCSLKVARNQYEPIDIFDADRWKALNWLPSGQRHGAAFTNFADNLTNAGSLSTVLAKPSSGVIEVKFAGNPKNTRFIFAVRQGHTEPNAKNWKFSFERGDGTVPVWSAARDPTLSRLTGSLQSFSAHATIFDDRWVLDELHRELLSALAIVDRPIAGAGTPIIPVVVDGSKELWSLERISIMPAATFAAKNDDVVAVVQLVFHHTVRHFKSGAYEPRVALRQDDTVLNMNVREITTPEDIESATLAFEARVSPASFDEGPAEIILELPGTQNASELGEYIVLMN